MALFKQIIKTAHQWRLDARLTLLRLPFSCLLIVSFWINACSPGGSTKNYYNTTQNQAGSPAGQSSVTGGGGATGDGGGGQGVQCGDALYVRDIYEAKVNDNRKMKVLATDKSDSNEVSKEAIQVLVKSLQQYFGAASSNLEFTKEQFWTDFIGKISFLDEDRVLVPSQDANSPIALRKDCQLVQIAYWSETAGKQEDGTLYVSMPLWKKLDQLNKIALLAHEYFFKNARKALYTNSDTVRNRVGLLLSEQGLAPLFSKWIPSRNKELSSILPGNKRGFKYCEGTTSEDPNAKIQLYQYAGSDNLQHIVIPVISSSSINSDLLQGSEISFDPKLETGLEVTTDLMLYQSIASIDGFSLYHEYSLSPYREWTWVDRWFSESVINIERTFGERIAVAHGMPLSQVVSHFKSSPKVISITLENSLSNWKPFTDKKLLSPADLKTAIHSKVRSELKNDCKIPSGKIDRALARLHHEINSALSSGTYPDDFPLWNEELSTLISTYQANDPKKTTSCGTVNPDRLKKELPALLFKLALDNYDENDVFDIIGMAGFETPQASDLPRVKLKVEQASSSLEFNLTCKDYNDVFNRIMKAPAQKESSKFVAGKIVKNNFERYTIGETTEKDRQIVKYLADIFKFDSGECAFQDFLQKSPRDGTKKEEYPYGIPSEDLEAFLSELYEAKDVIIDACVVNHRPKEDYRSHSTESNCIVISMPPSNSKYLYYFLENPGTYPLIQLIRRVSAEQL